MSTLFDGIIIGAGISGLTLASRLRKQNKSFLILEKSAGVGGRIATRRGEDCAYDHGAQFIKISSKDEAWSQDFSEVNQKSRIWFSAAGNDHLVFPKGMTQFPKSLMNPAEIKLNERVLRIKRDQEIYILETDKNEKYSARQVFVTCPLPQALTLLKDSEISYPQELENIQYASALVGLFRLQSSDQKISAITYEQDLSEEIFSISNQFSKEVSSNLAFTVVMQPTWSATHFEKDDANSLRDISEAFKKALDQISPSSDYVLLNSQLKKWRFSHPLHTAEASYQFLGAQKGIILLGDAFGGGSILGAIRSAQAVPLE